MVPVFLIAVKSCNWKVFEFNFFYALYVVLFIGILGMKVSVKKYSKIDGDIMDSLSMHCNVF